MSPTRRAAVVVLLALAAAFGASAWQQPAPSAADSVMGSETR